MTRISKYKVNDEILDKLFYLLFEVLSNKQNIGQFNDILTELLSPTERIMIAKRVAIIYMLMKGVDCSVIIDSLKVSSATISKFQIIVENGKFVVEALKKVVRNEKIIDFFEKLVIDFRGPGTYGVDWKSAWQQKIDFEKRKERGI